MILPNSRVPPLSAAFLIIKVSSDLRDYSSHQIGLMGSLLGIFQSIQFVVVVFRISSEGKSSPEVLEPTELLCTRLLATSKCITCPLLFVTPYMHVAVRSGRSLLKANICKRLHLHCLRIPSPKLYEQLPPIIRTFHRTWARQSTMASPQTAPFGLLSGSFRASFGTWKSPISIEAINLVSGKADLPRVVVALLSSTLRAGQETSCLRGIVPEEAFKITHLKGNPHIIST